MQACTRPPASLPRFCPWTWAAPESQAKGRALQALAQPHQTHPPTIRSPSKDPTPAPTHPTHTRTHTHPHTHPHSLPPPPPPPHPTLPNPPCRARHPPPHGVCAPHSRHSQADASPDLPAVTRRCRLGGRPRRGASHGAQPLRSRQAGSTAAQSAVRRKPRLGAICLSASAPAWPPLAAHAGPACCQQEIQALVPAKGRVKRQQAEPWTGAQAKDCKRAEAEGIGVGRP